MPDGQSCDRRPSRRRPGLQLHLLRRPAIAGETAMLRHLGTPEGVSSFPISESSRKFPLARLTCSSGGQFRI